MVELDAVIDHSPSEELIKDLAELRIRNLLCFRELEEYDRTGHFLYKHPLISSQVEYNSLIEMLKADPELFLDMYAKTKENITRYKSRLNSSKRTQEQKDKDKSNLHKHITRSKLLKEILKERV